MRSLRRTLLGTIAAATLVAAPATASVERDLDPLESYTYVRVLDGRATLASQGEGPGEEAELNQPLLSGDRVSVARGARLELSLADRNLLRVGGDSALTLTRIAFSGDRGDRSTRIELHEGEIVLVVTSDALGDSLPEVATPGAEVVVHEPGSYRIETDRSGWTELVVREGFAEVVTARGSTIVRAGESAVAYGDRWSGVDVVSAGAEDTLERWGRALDAGAQSASSALLHVEPELAYQAAPLAESGSWVSYDSAWYWRPTAVAVDWRPYWSGRWLWTPSGLTWVSSEPWAWVTYHYGTWCQVPGYGWAWRPGRVYSPAWVYWHWSDAWVGWCPVGYYTGWYGPGYYGPGFRWGVYGWSSGSWGYYSSWNFCPTRRLRHCDPRHDLRRGRDLDRELGGRVPRGLVTTDTRGLPRDGFTEEGAGSRELLGRVNRRLEAQPMVDVTDFVARRRDLPPAVEKAVRAEPEARIRLADVPRVAGDDRRTTRPAPRPGSGEDLGSRRIATDRAGTDGRPGTTVRDVEPRLAPPGRAQTERSDESGRSARTAPPSSATDGRDARRQVDDGAADSRRSGPPATATPRSVPEDRQQWRRDDGVRSVEPPAREPARQRPTAAPRLEPGEGAEIGSDGSVRRLPAGRPGNFAETPPARGATPPATDSRQGWRSREGWSGPEARTFSTTPRTRGAGQPSATGRDEPVQRILGGWRRSDPPATGSSAPSTGYRLPEARNVPLPPGTTRSPGSAPSTRGWTRDPGAVGRATPPPGGTRPSVTPPSGSRPSVTPPSGSRPSVSPPSSGSRSSSPPPSSSSGSRSSAQRSSKSDSPPPRKRGDRD